MKGTRSVILVLVLALAGIARSEQRVEVWVPTRTGVYIGVATELLGQLGTTSIQAELHVVAEQPSTTPANRAQLLIAIGAEAADYLITSKSQHDILATLVSGSVEYSWQEQAKLPIKQDYLRTVLRIEQPVSRLIALASIVAADNQRYGALLDEGMAWQGLELAQAVRAVDGQFNTRILSAGDNPIRGLQAVLEHSDIYLALPGSAEFNQATAPWVVQLSLRERVPVIGYSPAYTEAGALVALYSSPSQLAQQTARLVQQYFNQPNISLLPKYYPDEFSIAVNWHVANALGIELPDIEALKQKVQQLQAQPGGSK